MSGEPIALVLLPGMDGTGRLFAPLLTELPDWLDPVVVAYPPDRPLDYAGHLEIALAALPRDRPFVLLGESYSGPLALMAARLRPAGLRGVILSASFISSPLPAFVSRLSFLVAPWTVRLVPWGIRRWMSLGGNGSGTTRMLLDAVHGTVTPGVLAARVKGILALDAADALGACPVPLLCLAASNDRLVGRRSLARIRAVRPDVTVVTLDGPHLILQESPAAAARVIADFCRALPGGDRPPATKKGARFCVTP